MNTHFTCIPLGVKGGLDESNLPAFLLAPISSRSFICLDAGTLLAGLKIAYTKGCFNEVEIPADSDLNPEGYILHHHIKAYLITHSYLDHVQGLINISPEDNDKQVYGLPDVLGDIQTHLFNWRSWPNLCDRGVQPAVGKYRYIQLDPGDRTPVAGTQMAVQAFPLSHGGKTESSAFLIKAQEHYILYMGDTGPDEVEKNTRTQDLWEVIAPLVRDRKLHGVFIEASYQDERPDEMLFSHLTPAWIMRSFQKLAKLVDGKDPQKALNGLNVIITHMKPDFRSGEPVEEVIRKQLVTGNTLGLNLIFAKQGERFEV